MELTARGPTRAAARGTGGAGAAAGTVAGGAGISTWARTFGTSMSLALIRFTIHVLDGYIKFFQLDLLVEEKVYLA